MDNLLGRLNWQDRAACRDLPLELFFPLPGPKLHAQTQEAKAVCSTCPVQQDCLEYALTFVRGRVIMLPGIYGGLTESERWRLARTRVINNGPTLTTER